MGKAQQCSAEVRTQAVPMVWEHRDEYGSEWAATSSIASNIGCTAGTLRNWVRRAEIDSGRRDCVTSAERARIKELAGGNRELRRAHEILRAASPHFAHPELDRDRSDGAVDR